MTEQTEAATLRRSAEAQLKARQANSLPEGKTEDTQRLLHELQVRQIELEMQNERLREAKLELETALDRYTDFFEFAPVGYLTITSGGMIADINHTGAELLKRPRGELLLRPFARFLAPNDADVWHLHIQRAIQQHDKLDCELTLQHEDGTKSRIRVDSLRAPADGQLPVVRVVLTDITERHRMDMALAESELRFRLFMDALPAIAFIKDEDGRLVFANHRMEDTLGTRDWKGQPASRLFTSNVAERMIADDRHALQAGQVVAEEVVPNADGEMRVFQTHKFRIPRQGFPPLLGGIALDITTQKRAQTQLEEMAASLETSVSKRTRELRQLAVQLAMTEERERQNLAQELHDNLSQYLIVLRIKLDQLNTTDAPATVTEMLRLLESAERSVRMVTRSLSPTTLNSRGLLPTLQWLVNEIKEMYGLDVLLAADGEPPLILEAVQSLLYRSARELLINVAKHAKVTQAELTFLCDDHQLILVVSDDGQGFDPGRQPSHTNGQEPFGLRSIAERIFGIGGEMAIDSGVGTGTTVTLTVPYSVATS